MLFSKFGKKKKISESKALLILDNLFMHTDGHQLSSNYRAQHQTTEKSLTYGEIKFAEFASVLKKCQPELQKNFYDIGSGAGKPCLTAATLFNFEKVTGIEFIPDLHTEALKAKEQIADFFDEDQAEEITSRLNFINNDALLEDFSDGDIVFCNSTCFSYEFLDQLLPKFEQLKKGAYLICLTKAINSDQFKLIFESTEIAYSWGNPTTRIYQKII